MIHNMVAYCPRCLRVQCNCHELQAVHDPNEPGEAEQAAIELRIVEARAKKIADGPEYRGQEGDNLPRQIFGKTALQSVPYNGQRRKFGVSHD